MRQQALLESVDAVRAQLDTHRPYTPDVGERLREWILPRFIYCSNALGDKKALSGPETAAFLEREVVSGGHHVDKFLGVLRQRRALEVVEERASEGGLIDVPFLQLLHRHLWEGSRLTAETPSGKWKREPSRPTVRRGRTMEYLAPEQVEEAMHALCTEFARRRREGHPLLAITWFYFHFQRIHPFTRGNGQVVRLAAACGLLNHGYPYLIIPPGEVGTYIDALLAVDSTIPSDDDEPLSPRHDLTALLEFFSNCLIRTGERMLDVLSDKKMHARNFAGQIEREQSTTFGTYLHRKDMSWRVRATAEVRALHERLGELVSNFEVRGALYRIALVRSEIVPVHTADGLLTSVIPRAEAGLVGEHELEIKGEPTTRGLKFPQMIRLVIGVVSTSYGIQILLATSSGAEPRVNNGPARSPEWPTATLDEIATRFADQERKGFEKEVNALNSSTSQRYKLIREQLRAAAAQEEPDLASRYVAKPEPEESARGKSEQLPRDQRLDGLKPAEPPLNF